MTDPAILFVKPKAIRPADKAALRKAGVVVVEVEDPSAVKFVRAQAELSSTQLLDIAARVIKSSPYSATCEAFGRAVAVALQTVPPSRTEPPP